MTLQIGIKCFNGLVMGSDSMESTIIGNIGLNAVAVNKTWVSKNSAVAVAGDAMLGDRFGQLIISSLADNGYPDWADDLTKQMLGDLEKIRMIQTPTNLKSICNFSAVVGHVVNQKCQLVEFGDQLMHREIGHDNYYRALGSGAVRATPLLQYYIDEYCPNGMPSTKEGFFLTYMTLKYAISGSPSYIGYPIRIIVMEETHGRVKTSEHVLEKEYTPGLKNVDREILNCEKYLEEMRNQRVEFYHVPVPDESNIAPEI